jgi:parvulin-like peptidyl-prolyl isomerase
MFITSSKNLNKKTKLMLIRLTKYFPFLKYKSRKNSSLEKLAKKALTKNIYFILVLQEQISNKNNKKILVIKKYSFDKKLKIFRWEKKYLEIKNIKFFNKIKIKKEPILIKADTKKEKELKKFFYLEESSLIGIYNKKDLTDELKIKVYKNSIIIFCNNQKILKIEGELKNV